MKIKYQNRPAEDMSINVPGNWVVSNKTSATRTKGELYKVIPNPKTKKVDETNLWYISKGGWPCKIGSKNVNSFRKALPSEIEQHLKNLKNED